MEFRPFLRGKRDLLSTVGIGGSKLHLASEQEIAAILDAACDAGINIIDLATDNGDVFGKVGKALEGRRGQFMLGLHLGLTFQEDGQYKRTRQVDAVRQGFERQLADLGTDYADIGYIHYVDDMEDYKKVFSSGTYDLAVQLKREGRIRRIGFASHRPDICKAFLTKGDGEFDLFLFSINPAYDLDPVAHHPIDTDKSVKALDTVAVARERADLYRLAERLGVGITVMKAFGAGRLLSEKTSPFKRAMTPSQCIQYCLDRPGVISCMAGVSSARELVQLSRYDKESPDARDYSFIAGLHVEELLGKCVYCNHCLPCPSGIDIARVNKFLDLADIGDDLAAQHYRGLSHRAGECIACGSCEKNCPFGVAVMERMQAAETRFGS